MSTPFNVRAWASQAGIQTTGGFSVVAECVTVDELERFAALAYEAGRKDENEACVGAIKPNATPMEIATAIRARREQ